MRKALVLPVLAAAGGLAGLVIRQLQLRAAFEPGTGLPLSGHPLTYALWAAAAVTAGVLAALSLGSHRTFEKCYTSAFGRPSMVQLSAIMAGAVLFLAAGFFNVEAFVSATVDPYTQVRTVSVVRPVLGFVCLAAAAGIWFTAQKLRSGRQANDLWLLMPGFAGCLWVMANYQSWAQDPVVGMYVFSLLACLLSMLACGFLPGFAFGKGQVNLCLITCLLAGTLNILVLGDGLAMGDLALHMAMAFYLLSMASCLLSNDARPEPSAGLPTCGGSCQGCTGCGPLPPQGPQS